MSAAVVTTPHRRAQSARPLASITPPPVLTTALRIETTARICIGRIAASHSEPNTMGTPSGALSATSSIGGTTASARLVVTRRKCSAWRCGWSFRREKIGKISRFAVWLRICTGSRSTR